MIAVVKANGMGHGAVIPSRHLKNVGVERLAVATVEEGKELREANIGGPIHLLGNKKNITQNMPENDYDDHGNVNEFNGIVFYTINLH